MSVYSREQYTLFFLSFKLRKRKLLKLDYLIKKKKAHMSSHT